MPSEISEVSPKAVLVSLTSAAFVYLSPLNS
jgi:hypothetical protein